MKADKLRIALLISGGGTTAQAIIQACKTGPLKNVLPVCVIASRPDAGGIAKAEAEGVRTIVINRKACVSRDEFDEKLLEACRHLDLDFIGQYGWAPLTPKGFVGKYAGRLVNQHPAPLDYGYPDFGGEWMIGLAAHSARLIFVRAVERDHWTEATTHWVTTEFDKGQVIHARQVPILPHDSVLSLQQRVLPVEHQVQIEAIDMFASGSWQVVVRENRLILPGEEPTLEEAKRSAHRLFPHG